MSHKPNLTRALHTVADIARQTLRDPAVQDAAAGVLQHVGRKLADKAEHGAMHLRARLPAAEAGATPPANLGMATRRAGVALAEAMGRSSLLRERAGRQAAKLASHPAAGIAGQILREAEATFQRVRSEYDGFVAEARAAADAEATEAQAPNRVEAETETHDIPTGMAAEAIGSPAPAGPSKVRLPSSERTEDEDRWKRD
ncbi:hypothetical protein [Piscinibacter gummiphilus]|uniref:Uncharacterized protein n=1 Tax=Piscinibacter gummiphilus TaxID=946333 RepID=A0A1W6L947_9BURK|nr:hypothetical protein [Piscinibacter gummiphilus]ARN20762.1 hypothetical protein A4W93_13130 [Piscinibacter gummiphilus]ATU65437.1 hypothetical protein CPZ87_13205 [Piscinibacter gummiphilus]GLS94591.1 hypothetical protein GCM10007918_18830 [Piscinibacter gummiphilus]